MSFFLPKHTTKRTAMITTGMYLYEVFYSPGMGPVPFSYSAESFPIQVSLASLASNPCINTHQVRDVGMASATAVLWAFNFILSFTWPALVQAFKPQGAFGWYAAWCGILWLLSKHFTQQPIFTMTNNCQHCSSSQRPRSLPLKNWTRCLVSPRASRSPMDCASRGTGLTGTCWVAMLSCRHWWMWTSFVVSASRRGWLGVCEWCIDQEILMLGAWHLIQVVSPFRRL